MVLTVSFALSPVTGLFCHCHLADTSAKLDASVGASGPHDFAVRLPRVSSTARVSVHRISLPTSVTIAKRPSKGNEMAWDISVIWVNRERKYFCNQDWTTKITLIRLKKLAFG
jgi:hypothetical protein